MSDAKGTVSFEDPASTPSHVKCREVDNETFEKINKFLWCEDCRQSHNKVCSQYGKLSRIKDKCIPSRAKLTAPYQLSIRTMELRAGTNHVYGVFAKKILQKRTQFGPYEGDLTDTWRHDRNDRLKLKLFFEDGHADHLDCVDEGMCNWMMFVRPATSPKEQNAVAFQYKGAIYFVTTKIVAVNVELKVWYAEDYARVMGAGLLHEPEPPPPTPPSPFTEHIDEEFLSPPSKKPKIIDIDFQEIDEGFPEAEKQYVDTNFQNLVKDFQNLTENPTEKLEVLANVALQPISSNETIIASLNTKDATTFSIQDSAFNSSGKKSNDKVCANINDDDVLIIDIPDISSDLNQSSGTELHLVDDSEEVLQIIDPISNSRNKDNFHASQVETKYGQQIIGSQEPSILDNEYIDMGSSHSGDEDTDNNLAIDTAVTEHSREVTCRACLNKFPADEFKQHNCSETLLSLANKSENLTDNSNYTEKHNTRKVRSKKNVLKKMKSSSQSEKNIIKRDKQAIQSKKNKVQSRKNNINDEKSYEDPGETDTELSHDNTATSAASKSGISESKDDLSRRGSRKRKPLVNRIRRVKPTNLKKIKTARRRSIAKSMVDKTRDKLNTLKQKSKVTEKSSPNAIVKRPSSMVSKSKVRHPLPLLKCNVCEKAFHSENKLEHHIHSHTGEKPYRCSHEGCDKAFLTAFKLKRHITTHGIGSKFKCPYCDKIFGRKDHLKNHLRIHDPNKSLFRCTECQKMYASTYAFKAHIAFHKAQKGELKCYVCKEELPDKPALLHHLKVHQGARSVKDASEKKHKCLQCEKMFFTLKDVRRHSVVHTKERPFMCHLCPQRFGRKDHLLRHMKKAHGSHSEFIPEDAPMDDHADLNQLQTSEVSSPPIMNKLNTKKQEAANLKKQQSKSRKKKVKGYKIKPLQPKLKKIAPSITSFDNNVPSLPSFHSQPTLILQGGENDTNIMYLKDWPALHSNTNIVTDLPSKTVAVPLCHNSADESRQIIDSVPAAGLVNLPETVTQPASQNPVLEYIPIVSMPLQIQNDPHNTIVTDVQPHGTYVPETVVGAVPLEHFRNINNVPNSAITSLSDFNNGSISALLNPVYSVSSGGNQIPISMSLIQPSVDNPNLQFSAGENVGADFIAPESLVFPETNLTDIHQILNDNSKGIAVSTVNVRNSTLPQSVAPKITRKSKRQKNKSGTQQQTFSKQPTVKLPSLQSIQELILASQANQNASVQNNLANTSSTTNIQIPAFSSSFNVENINFGTQFPIEKIKSSAAHKSGVKSSNSIQTSFSTNPDSFSIIGTPLPSQQPLDSSSLNIAFLSFNEGANASSDSSGIQTSLQGITPSNIQMLQLVNVNDLNNQGQVLLTSPVGVTNSQMVQQSRNNTNQTILTSNIKGPVSNRTQVEGQPQQNPGLISYDSEAFKIFFSEEQPQH